MSASALASVPGPGQRMVWMDVLRGTAVFLVILVHAILLSPHGAPAPLEAFDRAMAPFRVPALMFLSGMLLPQSLAKPWRVYLRGKVSRILWPYLLWSTIVLAVTSFGTRRPDYLVELFVDPTSAMWYVGYLFVFYLVALLLGPTVRTALLVVAFLGTVLAQPQSLHLFTTLHIPSAQRLSFTFFCFLAGDLLARHRRRWLPALTRPAATLVSAVLALPAVVVAVAGWTVKYQPLYLVSTLAGLVAVIPLLTLVSGTVPGRFAATQGRSSMVFYVTHWPVQIVAWHAAVAVGLTGGLAVTVWNLVLALGVGFATVWLRSRLSVVDYLFDLHLERWARPAAVPPDVPHPPPASAEPAQLSEPGPDQVLGDGAVTGPREVLSTPVVERRR